MRQKEKKTKIQNKLKNVKKTKNTAKIETGKKDVEQKMWLDSKTDCEKNFGPQYMKIMLCQK